MELINKSSDELDAALESDLKMAALESETFCKIENMLVVIDELQPLDDLLACEISVPEFPQKINIHHEDELPSLGELIEPPSLDNESFDNESSLEQIIKTIEATVNFDSFDASMFALNNPDFLMNRIQGAFDTFKEHTGRQMTYSEMRHMMG
jgi:hypothetical protein